MNKNSLIDEVFFEATQIADSIARKEFLDQRCKGDPELRRRVDSMLASHEPAADFFARRGDAANALRRLDTEALAGWREGAKIGRYRLLQKLGEGGFGIVFAAEQEQPVRRMVALKLIKPGMDTREIIARFEAERQALALMDHLHIARVIDAGATEDGRPYFVMELVKGTPITEYCDKRNLTTEQRLQVFRLVCDAVEHAHQKGVIHRDIKPSNILVTDDGGTPTPKVIDFGVAKAISHKLTEKTIFTKFGQIIGTPEYMSPEQANDDAADVDTRTDIYSLGIVLYELLTGSTPLSGEQLRSVGWNEMVRLIRQEKIVRPSDQITNSAAELAVARKRGLQPQALRKKLRSELDWLVLRAIEKERSERYESVNNFASDIERYLNNQPVSARAPSTGYIVWKFVRRNRVTVGIASLLLISLLSGLAGTTLAWLEASAATTREEKQREVAVRALDLANETSVQMKKTLYRSLLAQSQFAIHEGRYDYARKLLEQCDPSERGWEWDHLILRSKNRETNLFPAMGAPSLVPDGREVYGLGSKLTRNNDGLWAWDLKTGAERLLLEMDERGAAGSALSRDGKRFVMADRGTRTLRVYDTETWTVVWESDAHAAGNIDINRISQIKFCSDGNRIATLQDGLVVRVFDASDGKLVSQRQTNGLANKIAISPNGRLVAANGQVWNATTGELIYDLDLRNIWCSCAFSHDGTILATAGFNGKVRLCRSTDGQFLREFPVQEGWTTCIVFHPSDRFLFTGGADTTIHVWDVESGHRLWTIGNHRSTVSYLDVSADGMRLVSSGTIDRTFSTWNVFESSMFTLHRHKGRLTGISHVPNQNQIVTTGFDATMKLWDASSGQLLKTIIVDSEHASKVAVHPDGHIAATVVLNSPEIDLWNLQSGKRIRRLVGHQISAPYDIAFTPNGENLVSAGVDQQLHVWDVQSGEISRTMSCVASPGQLSISPDSRFVAAPNRQGTRPKRIAVWEIETGRLHTDFHVGSNTALEFVELDDSDSPLQIVSGKMGPKILFSDMNTGEPIADTRGRDNVFVDFAYHPDVDRFWSACIDGTLTVRNLNTREQIASIDAHSQAFWMSVSDDGKTVATASADGTVKLFETEPVSPSIQSARSEVLAATMHVDARFDKHMFLKDVLNSLENDPIFDPDVHQRAVAIAKARGENVFELHRSCRRVVENKGLTDKEYSLALRQAEAAVHAAPDFVVFHTTLALAYFRLSDYANALENFRIANEMFEVEKKTRNPIPKTRQAPKDALTRKAYRAMSLFELGHRAAASSELEEFESSLNVEPWLTDDQLRSIYSEARTRMLENEDFN